MTFVDSARPSNQERQRCSSLQPKVGAARLPWVKRIRATGCYSCQTVQCSVWTANPTIQTTLEWHQTNPAGIEVDLFAPHTKLDGTQTGRETTQTDLFSTQTGLDTVQTTNDLSQTDRDMAQTTKDTTLTSLEVAQTSREVA